MNSARTYSEVLTFITTLGNPYINKIPNNLIEFLEKNKDPLYVVPKPINTHSFQKESISLIALLNLNYWCNETQKNKLLQIYKKNDDIQKQKLFDMFSTTSNTNATVTNQNESKNISKDLHPTIIKQNLFQKIIIKIKNIFKIK